MKNQCGAIYRSVSELAKSIHQKSFQSCRISLMAKVYGVTKPSLYTHGLELKSREYRCRLLLRGTKSLNSKSKYEILQTRSTEVHAYPQVFLFKSETNAIKIKNSLTIVPSAPHLSVYVASLPTQSLVPQSQSLNTRLRAPVNVLVFKVQFILTIFIISVSTKTLQTIIYKRWWERRISFDKKINFVNFVSQNN